MGLHEEIRRRRTFAIISHPDAGKTTLTEKLLLYGGAVQLAGSVTARRNQRQSTSDWMELERARGISISATVLQFDYDGYRINLLDTPGHQDFSEDTYRVLTAVDGVVMVIDAAKGIEQQTRKLFAICRRRGIPIFTFMNKLDRPTKDPLALLDELESVLQIGAVPMNWPLGTGFEFRGLYDRREKQVHLYEMNANGAYRAPVNITDLHDGLVRERLPQAAFATMLEELEMLDHAGVAFDADAVLQGRMTPVYYGSARNNFGVQLLLDGFLALAGGPRPRSSKGVVVPLEAEPFSGFVFKIQANMDPRHRDRIAFLRVCSGIFQRDTQATHSRTGKTLRLSNAARLFGQQRETVEEAYPGDIIGLVGHSSLGIGDTLSEDPSVVYDEIPHFPPEHFVMLHNPHTGNYKKFRDGVSQLLQEGVVQGFELKGSGQRIQILAAVGPLQFEVVQYRLESEYGAPSRLEKTDWKILRWVDPSLHLQALPQTGIPAGCALVENGEGQLAILFQDQWGLNYFIEKNPAITLSELPFDA